MGLGSQEKFQQFFFKNPYKSFGWGLLTTAAIRSSTITSPFFGYNIFKHTEDLPFNKDTICIMAVDNLPCELPRSASEEFGRDLIDRILPCLFIDDPEKIIERGTIASNGKLTSHFEYLSDYIA